MSIYDRSGKPVLRRPVEPELNAHVAVMDQLIEVVAGSTPVPHGHLQRCDRQIRSQRPEGLPADDHPAVDVDDERHVDPMDLANQFRVTQRPRRRRSLRGGPIRVRGDPTAVSAEHLQIGSTPNLTRCASMNAITSWTGGTRSSQIECSGGRATAQEYQGGTGCCDGGEDLAASGEAVGVDCRLPREVRRCGSRRRRRGVRRGRILCRSRGLLVLRGRCLLRRLLLRPRQFARRG